jgi:hypothetical protein
MRTAAYLALLLLGPCDKADATAGDASPATPTATAAATATAGGAGGAAGGTATAAATTPAAAGAGGGGAGAGGGVGNQNKGVFANTDAGATIVNNDKKLTFDGGALNLQNGTNKGSITQNDGGGATLNGADGKTLTIPPIPGVK